MFDKRLQQVAKMSAAVDNGKEFTKYFCLTQTANLSLSSGAKGRSAERGRESFLTSQLQIVTSTTTKQKITCHQ